MSSGPWKKPFSTIEKACTKCGIVKKMGEFGRTFKSRDGRHSECKMCGAEHRRTVYPAWYSDNAEDSRARSRAWRRKNPKHAAFFDQRKAAKKRGIEFLFTLEAWIEFWGDRFEFRGRGDDDLCMGRFGDEGPYRLGNVYICSMSENKDRPRSLPEPNF